MERQAPEEEDDYEEDNMLTASGKSHCVFMIDASLGMQSVPVSVEGTNMSPFQATLKCLISFIRQKIRAADVDQYGISFYGTEKNKSLSTMANIFTLAEVGKPDIEHVNQLEKFLNEPAYFQKIIGSAPPDKAQVFNCMNEASKLLKSTSKNVKKFLYVVTNQDNPIHDDSKEFSSLDRRSEDLVNAKISFEVIGLNSGNEQEFSYERVYRKLAYYSYPDEDEPRMQPISCENNFRAMFSLFRSKVASRRTAFNVPFSLGEGLSIGIRGFNLIMIRKRLPYTHIDKRSSTPVKAETTHICATSSKDLESGAWDFFYEFGGVKAKFSKAEITEMKSGGTPGMSIIGFRPKSEIKLKFNLKPSIFVVPNDDMISGSSSFFAHLVERLHARGMVAICKLVSRLHSPPKLVALLAQLGAYDVERDEDLPTGFHMITLPFADDIRSINSPAADTIDEGLVERFHPLLSSLSMPYHNGDISNPVLDKHFQILDALATEAEDPIMKEDETMPNYENIKEKAGVFLEEFAEFHELNTPKRGGNDEIKSDADVRAAVQDGSFMKWTIPILTEILKAKKIKISSKKKADLLASVRSHFGG